MRQRAHQMTDKEDSDAEDAEDSDADEGGNHPLTSVQKNGYINRATEHHKILSATAVTTLAKRPRPTYAHVNTGGSHPPSEHSTLAISAEFCVHVAHIPSSPHIPLSLAPIY